MTRKVPTYELYGEKSGQTLAFWLHCETIPSRSQLHDWEIGLHRHESFFQILYISAGSGDASFDTETSRFESPAVIVVPPGRDHGFRFSRDVDGLVITVVAAHLGGLPAVWTAKPGVTRLGPDAVARELQTVCRRLGEEFSDRQPGRNVLLDAYLKSALVLIARLSNAGRDAPVEDRDALRIEQLNSLLHRHVRDHKTAAFYAGALGVSPTHLNRIVRARTGLGLHRLIARKLTEEAKGDLVFTAATVQGIGFRLGFADPGYFSRFFLRQTGNTPGAWRQAERARLAGMADTSGQSSE